MNKQDLADSLYEFALFLGATWLIQVFCEVSNGRPRDFYLSFILYLLIRLNNRAKR